MTTASVVTAALGGATSQLLIDLTNRGAATSIDSTVLDSAVTMAEGRFRTLTGIAPDSSLDWHTAPLIAGVLWALEFLKSRDSNMIKTRADTFKFECDDIRRKATMAPQTSSVLKPTAEVTNTKPDMDRGGKLIKGLTDGVSQTGGITDYSPSD